MKFSGHKFMMLRRPCRNRRQTPCRPLHRNPLFRLRIEGPCRAQYAVGRNRAFVFAGSLFVLPRSEMDRVTADSTLDFGASPPTHRAAEPVAISFHSKNLLQARAKQIRSNEPFARERVVGLGSAK